MSTSKTIFGLLVGAAAGAALGVLFAPAKGNVTRKKLSNKGKEYADDMRERFEELLGAATEKFEEGKKEATEFVDYAKKHATQVANEARSKAHSHKNEGHNNTF